MMKTDNVVDAEKKHDGSIELIVSDPLDGTEIKKRYLAIRGGISWPTAKAPAYFCVLGQEYIAPNSFGDTPPAGARILLAEHKTESLSLTGFYSKICDIAQQMLCRNFYAEMPEDRQDSGFLNDFDEFSKEHNSDVFLWGASDVDNFVLGLARIKGATDKGELTIPEDSIIYDQLRSIVREDLTDTPEETFPAINGLRFALGSFFRSPPWIRGPYRLPPPPNPYY